MLLFQGEGSVVVSKDDRMGKFACRTDFYKTVPKAVVLIFAEAVNFQDNVCPSSSINFTKEQKRKNQKSFLNVHPKIRLLSLKWFK